jgi:hypothetical protein
MSSINNNNEIVKNILSDISNNLEKLRSLIIGEKENTNNSDSSNVKPVVTEEMKQNTNNSDSSNVSTTEPVIPEDMKKYYDIYKQKHAEYMEISNKPQRNALELNKLMLMPSSIQNIILEIELNKANKFIAEEKQKNNSWFSGRNIVSYIAIAAGASVFYDKFISNRNKK